MENVRIFSKLPVPAALAEGNLPKTRDLQAIEGSVSEPLRILS
jgi:hypothetical protein